MPYVKLMEVPCNEIHHSGYCGAIGFDYMYRWRYDTYINNLTRNQTMIKTFAFILYVVNPTGEYSSFVIDYNLTATDCMELHESWGPTLDNYSTVFCFETTAEGES